MNITNGMKLPRGCTDNRGAINILLLFLCYLGLPAVLLYYYTFTYWKTVTTFYVSNVKVAE